MRAMGVLSSVVLLLIWLMQADARQWKEPMYMDQSNGNKISSTCDSCLEVSRKAGKSLNRPKLFMEVSMLSREVCQALPSHLRTKCLEISGAYLDQTRLFLQELFHEETLCNNTGLCLDNSLSPIDNKLISANRTLEVTDEGACDACRNSVKDILTRFQESNMKTKIMDALLDYCEELEEHTKKCKQVIYKYAPVVFTKLNKMKTSDLCRLAGFCDEGISM